MAGKKTDDRVLGQRIGDNFRTAAGLPPRKGDGPTDPSKASELSVATEPEGGYGGHGETELDEGAVKSEAERDAENISTVNAVQLEGAENIASPRPEEVGSDLGKA